MGMITPGALTGLRAAAFVRAAGTPDVAAAGVGAALTPAYAQEEEDEEASQGDHDHKQPVCREKGTSPEEGPEGGLRDTGTGVGVGAKLFAKLVGKPQPWLDVPG